MIRLFILALMVADNCSTCFMMNLYKNQHKCFYALLQPENTLVIKFGFPRKIRDNCQFQLTIDYHSMTTEVGQEQRLSYQNLYNKTSFCEQKIPGQLTVLKYIGKDQLDLGKYKICVRNLNDYGTNKSLFQLIISQQYNPIKNLKLQEKESIVVNSQDFMTLQQTIMIISKKISLMKNKTIQVLTASDLLQKNMKEKWDISIDLMYFQVIIITFYAIFWLCLARFYIFNTNQL